MGANRGMTVLHHLLTWTRYGLIAVGWFALAFLVALACLAHIGLFDVSPYLVGPDPFSHRVDGVGPVNFADGRSK
jgi:hypothetical protein